MEKIDAAQTARPLAVFSRPARSVPSDPEPADLPGKRAHQMCRLLAISTAMHGLTIHPDLLAG
ncbi:hypothetical protein E4P82_07590 [Candidatus Competibacter phosphatis]|uniref:Uncharacterized protein n=1 Tax=Candidatus Competibacter phosphatis TaxID=221280 RepID=A0ABX1TI68_9GAMM|nr:hypothetical protein [Candidatus Competibacter phosphatis]